MGSCPNGTSAIFMLMRHQGARKGAGVVVRSSHQPAMATLASDQEFLARFVVAAADGEGTAETIKKGTMYNHQRQRTFAETDAALIEPRPAAAWLIMDAWPWPDRSWLSTLVVRTRFLR